MENDSCQLYAARKATKKKEKPTHSIDILTSNTIVHQMFVSISKLIRKFHIICAHDSCEGCGRGLWEGELLTRDENWKLEHSLQLVITNLGTFKVKIL